MVIAGGPEAVFTAVEGAEDVAAAGREAAAALGAGDLLIAISASSVTTFARGALRQAAANGSRTVLLTCASSDGLEQLADEVIALDTGAEVKTAIVLIELFTLEKAACVSLGR